MNFDENKFEKQEKPVDFGVAFEVPPEIAEESFRLRDLIISRNVQLITFLKQTPHITLFQGEFPADRGLQQNKRHKTETGHFQFVFDYRRKDRLLRENDRRRF